jgi:hypothetical protein
VQEAKKKAGRFPRFLCVCRVFEFWSFNAGGRFGQAEIDDIRSSSFTLIPSYQHWAVLSHVEDVYSAPGGCTMSTCKILLLVTASLYLSLVSNGAAENSAPIPAGVKSVLDQMHPGWKLAEISDENRQICFKKDSKYRPTLIWGDFDGDGKMDFAAIVTYGKKSSVMAFLARGTGYKAFELFTPSRPNERTPDLLEVLPKGMQLGTTARKYAHESIAMEYCESSSVFYFYEAGVFHRVVSED